MSCESTMRAVERFLEGEAGPESLGAGTEAGAHAATCERCRAEVEAALRLSEALQGALLTAAPEGAMDRALAAVQAEAAKEAPAPVARTGARLPGPRRLVPFAIAASALVCTGLALMYMLETGEAPRRQATVIVYDAFTSADAKSLAKAGAANFGAAELKPTLVDRERKEKSDLNQKFLEDPKAADAERAVLLIEAGKFKVDNAGTQNKNFPESIEIDAPIDAPSVTFATADGSAGPARFRGTDVGGTTTGSSSGASVGLGTQGTSTSPLLRPDPGLWKGPDPYAPSDPRSRAAQVRAHDEAITRAIAQTQKDAEDKLRALSEESARQMEQQQADADRREKESAERMEKLKRNMALASAADKAKMQAELDRLGKQPTSETARKIITENEASLVAIYSESYVQAPGAKERTPICKLEATGVAVGPERILTARHVVQPWRYDPKMVATAKKLKEDQGLEVQDYVEVYRKTEKGWAKAFDTASGSLRIATLGPDRLEEKTQAVEVEWNQQITAVPGIRVMKRNTDDVALLEAPGAGFRPVSIGSGAQKFDNVIVLGTVRNADNKLISVSPARAEVQTLVDAVFSVNATVPTSFGGGAVFKYDGSVYGIVAGPEAQNLVCTRIEHALKLLTAPAPAAPTGTPAPGGGKGGPGGGGPRAPLGDVMRDLGSGALLAKGADGTAEPMPLERVKVEAEIAGTLATTLVRQRFANPFASKIEALYAFPLPHDAAVNEFVMEIGGRRILGLVRERAEAQRMYRSARAAGLTVSLLEQERPNVFTIALANLEPARVVDVTIRFFQALAPQDGSLEYVLPLVIGHRYGAPSDVLPSARLPSGAAGPECEIEVTIDAGVPIARVECPSHDVAVERYGPFRARVVLPSRRDAMDRDFVLRLVLGDPKEASFGLVAHAGPLGRFVQVVAAPPLAPDDARVEAREVIFVLDSSGSMSGVPIEQSKRFMRRALSSLRAKDVFTVATFAGTARLWNERFITPSPEAIRSASQWVEKLEGAGGTEAEAGIRLALETPGDPRRVRIVVFLTDGGVWFQGDIFRRIRDSGAGARVFALGVGSAPNRDLLDKMADAGRGVAAYIAQDASEGEIAKQVDALYARLDAPVLTDVCVEAEGIELADVYPRRAPDLFVGRTLSFVARFKPGWFGRGGAIIVRGRAGGQVVEWRIEVSLPDVEPRHAALAPIWARAQIADREAEIPLASSDEKRRELEDEIRRTALEFHLASRCTSFIAVDEEGPRTEGGAPARVVQPASVPAGVDAGSFGGGGG